MYGGADLRGAVPLQLRPQQEVQGEAGEAEGSGHPRQERRNHLPDRNALLLSDARGRNRGASLPPTPHRIPFNIRDPEEPFFPTDPATGHQGPAAGSSTRRGCH